MSSEKYAIEIAGLKKSFGETRVLNDICLTVKSGESLVLIGLSGSGKSVLLNHVIGFLKPDEGEVSVLGRSLNGLGENELYRLLETFGVVFQGSALFDSMSAAENVCFPLKARSKGRFSKEEVQTRAAEMLYRVGLSHEDGERRPSQMSGGMQRRVAIARALIAEPEILLYDEPTSGLDSATSDQIGGLIREVNRRSGATSLTVTHDYHLAAQIADRVVFLDRETGGIEEVLSSKEIRELRSALPEGETPLALQRKLEGFLRKKASMQQRDMPPLPASGNLLRGLLERGMGLVRLVGDLFLMAFRIKAPLGLEQLGIRVYQIGMQSLPLIGASSVLIGIILSGQAALGLAPFGAETQVPRVVTESMVREVGPLITALLLAGRVGASLSAEIGSMKVTHQIDALRAMAVDPDRYLFSPIVWAALIAFPVLTLLAELLGLLGGYLTYVHFLHESSVAFIHDAAESIRYVDMVSTLIKSLGFGAAIAVIGYYYGTSEKRGSEEVGAHTTRAVVVSSLMVIFLDFVISQTFAVLAG